VISGNGLHGVNVVQAGTSGKPRRRQHHRPRHHGHRGPWQRGRGGGRAGGDRQRHRRARGGERPSPATTSTGFASSMPGQNNNRVQSNLIGTDITGSAGPRQHERRACAWEREGRRRPTSSAARWAGYGNLISGNGASGIHVRDFVSGTLIAGNTIGTNAAGNAALPNLQHGVYLLSARRTTTVGGTTIPERKPDLRQRLRRQLPGCADRRRGHDRQRRPRELRPGRTRPARPGSRTPRAGSRSPTRAANNTIGGAAREPDRLQHERRRQPRGGGGHRQTPS